jgi:hypothetical protein
MIRCQWKEMYQRERRLQLSYRRQAERLRKENRRLHERLEATKRSPFDTLRENPFEEATR